MNSLTDHIFDILRGPQWLGIRVRAATHRPNISYQGHTVFSMGTVVDFCGTVNKHLVVFDEEFLQPKWICCEKKTVELETGTSLRSNGEWQQQQQDKELGQGGLSFFTNSLARKRGADKENSNFACQFCGLQVLAKNWLQCNECGCRCHNYCAPSTDLLQQQIRSVTSPIENKGVKNQWKCWKCIVCSGCYSCLWDKELTSWNIRSIEPEVIITINNINNNNNNKAPDRSMNLCGLCLGRYKHSREFCPICFELYTEEPEKEEEGTKKTDSESLLLLSPLNNGEQNISGEEQGVLKDPNKMVQCNECSRWAHAHCEGIDDVQYKAINLGTHPIWGDEYLCPSCRVTLTSLLISKLEEIDVTKMFALPVTKTVAKNYFDVIRNPMDLLTMLNKSKRGQYKSLQALRQDFELMCLNALVYNKADDEYWMEAKSVFWKGTTKIFSLQNRKTYCSAYGNEVIGLIGPQATTDSKVAKRKVDQQLPTVDKIDGAVGRKKNRLSLEQQPNAEGGSDVTMKEKQFGKGKKKKRLSNPEPNNTSELIGEDAMDISGISVKKESDEVDGNEDVIGTGQTENNNGDTTVIENIILPLELTEPLDPPSYLVGNIIIQTIEEGFYTSHQDICFLCGSAGSTETILFCCDCGEAYHSYCTDAPIFHMRSDYQIISWRCMNCKVCVLCGESQESDGNNLVYCDLCDNGYHMMCLQPHLEKTDDSINWYCADCIECSSCPNDKFCWGSKINDCFNCFSSRATPIVSEEKHITESDIVIIDHPFVSVEEVKATEHLAINEDKEQFVEFLGNNKMNIGDETPSAVDLDQRIKKNLSLLEEKKNQSINYDKKISKDVDEFYEIIGSEINYTNGVNKDIVVHCSICNTLTDNYIKCSICNKMSHIACNLLYHEHWIKQCDHVMDDYCCDRCLENESALNDLKLSKEQVDICKAIANIQRGRLELKNSILALSHNKVDNDMRTFWRRHKILLISLIRLAIMRINWLETENIAEDFRNIENLDGSYLSKYPGWLRGRAIRFSACLRRNGTLTIEQNMKKRKNLMYGLNSNGADLDIDTLSSLASMASAFLQFTNPTTATKTKYLDTLKFISQELVELAKKPCSDESLSILFGLKDLEVAHILKYCMKLLIVPPIFSRTMPDISTRNMREKYDFLANKSILTNSKLSAQASDALNSSRENKEWIQKIRSDIKILQATLVKDKKKKLKKGNTASITTASGVNIVLVNRKTISTKEQKKQTFDLTSSKKPGQKKSSGIIENTADNDKIIENKLDTEDKQIKKPKFSEYGSVKLDTGLGYYASKALKQFLHWESIPSDIDLELAMPDLPAEIKELCDSVNSARNKTVEQILLRRKVEDDIQENNNDQSINISEDNKIPEISNENSNAIYIECSESIKVALLSDQQDRNDEINNNDKSKAEVANDSSEFIPPMISEISNQNACEANQLNDGIPINDNNSVNVNPLKTNIEVVPVDFPVKYVDNNTSESEGNLSKLVPLTHTTEGNEQMEVETAFCGDCNTTDEKQVDMIKNHFVIQPLKGWAVDEMGPNLKWEDPRVCCFCHDNTEDRIVGRFMAFNDGVYCHLNCVRWSTEVIERNGVLHNSLLARERSLKSLCYLCRQNGATIGCLNRKKCKRNFHLRCAIVCKVTFFEAKKITEDVNSNHDILSMCFCAEHVSDSIAGSDLKLSWSPGRDIRRHIVLSELDIDLINNVSDLLSQKRSDKAVRIGTITILSIGTPRIDLPDFHTTQYIYPHRFRSSRIFWSMKNPLKRTVYFFEVFLLSDFESLNEKKISFIKDALFLNSNKFASIESTKSGSASSVNNSNNCFIGGIDTSKDIPIFRVVAVDNHQDPIFTVSVDHAYAIISDRVNQLNFSSRLNAKYSTRKTMDSYGLNGHQFFGIGLPFVRRAIEWIPESVSAMIGSEEMMHLQYKPSYRLPTIQDALLIHKMRETAKEKGNFSVNGCARADGLDVMEQGKMSEKKVLTRILSKAVDQLDHSNNNNNVEDDLDVDEEEVNMRDNERNKIRYIEMSEAYLRNPNAKLEVRKSRIHGWGLFAKINFEKNDIIVEYIGQKIRQVVADRREVMYEVEGVGSCYLFRLDKEDIIDATRTGGMARFINHCCEPNAYARVIPADGEKHICIMAARDIQEGEEITYDYKFPIEDKKLKCYCGAPGCQGSMN